MKIQTSLELHGITINVYGEYSPAQRGSRDRYGVPLEPDDDEEVFINDTFVDGKNLTSEEIAKMLEMNEDDLNDILETALMESYHYDKEAAAEARAIDIYESKKLRDENY
jgi:hypothetical protein